MMVGYAIANPPCEAQADGSGEFPKSCAKSGPNLTTVPPWFGQTRMKSGQIAHLHPPAATMPATSDNARRANAILAEAKTSR